jgi:hypothetical protein
VPPQLMFMTESVCQVVTKKGATPSYFHSLKGELGLAILRKYDT